MGTIKDSLVLAGLAVVLVVGIIVTDVATGQTPTVLDSTLQVIIGAIAGGAYVKARQADTATDKAAKDDNGTL